MNATTDICASRHQGNAESESAHNQQQPTAEQRREVVYRAIKQAGLRGLTVAELAKRWGVGSNVISGRFSELKAEGKIEKTGRRLNDSGTSSAVCVASEIMQQWIGGLL